MRRCVKSPLAVCEISPGSAIMDLSNLIRSGKEDYDI